MTDKKELNKKELEVLDSNYLIIEFKYDNTIILPYKEGMALLQTLEKAQRLKNGYGDSGHILPFRSDRMEITIISKQEYIDRKWCTAMNISYTEFLQSKKDD